MIWSDGAGRRRIEADLFGVDSQSLFVQPAQLHACPLFAVRQPREGSRLCTRATEILAGVGSSPLFVTVPYSTPEARPFGCGQEAAGRFITWRHVGAGTAGFRGWKSAATTRSKNTQWAQLRWTTFVLCSFSCTQACFCSTVRETLQNLRAGAITVIRNRALHYS